MYICIPYAKRVQFCLEIDWHGFFGANTDTQAIHGPIAYTDNQYFKFFKSGFLLHYKKYNVFYALTFLQKLQK